MTLLRCMQERINLINIDAIFFQFVWHQQLPTFVASRLQMYNEKAQPVGYSRCH